MNSIYFKKRQSAAIPPFDIRYSIFCGSLFEMFWSLNIEIWNLFVIWCLKFGILLFLGDR